MTETSTENSTTDEVIDPKVEGEINKVVAEEVKIEEKLDDPRTSDAEKEKLEQRLTDLDAKLDALMNQVGELAKSPVAPSPRKTVEVKDEAKGEGVDETVVETPKERKHRYGSSRWFGDRAYED